MFLGYQNNKIKFYTEQQLDTTLYNLDKIEETQEVYVLDGDEYVLYDDVQKAKELANAKEIKQQENTDKAKEAIEQGYVLYKDAQFETNTQTCSDLTSTMLIMQASGLETYTWLSKDDKVVELTLEDFAILGGVIAGYKNSVWNMKYIQYKEQIENAETKEEVEAIEINYDVN